ncbi:MAG: hypothetical protein E7606_06155 [Ruminococcaceae bacterium]|nr:hypothetical protein [Oscillospiraceae bacterium]
MKEKKPLTLRHLILFAMLGALMACSQLLMALAPNIHLIGMFVMAFTLVYRAKALIPIYVYVFLLGLYYGFPMNWWGAYLYIWTILWGVTMLLPRRMPPLVAPIVYMAVCGLHGLLFGVLYAPYTALVMGQTFEQMLATLAAGLWFDLLHVTGNLAAGVLIIPMQKLLLRLEKQ